MNEENKITDKTLPKEIVSFLKRVKFTLSNYEKGTIGKNLSVEAKNLLIEYNADVADKTTKD